MTREQPPAAKRHKTGELSPSSFVTWNCNGFISRCKGNVEEMKKLVTETNHPDVICLQEVRLKASQHSRGQALKSEYDIVREVIENVVFQNYEKFWSLSDKRYAGTLTLVHKRVGFQGRIAFTPEAAINLQLAQYNITRQEVGLPLEENTEVPQKKQTSLKSFFAPKVSAHPSPNESHQHNSDGRFQFLRFENLDLIHTYVPNNGNKRESYVRRKEWDDEMKKLLVTRQKILDQSRNQDRPLLWLGDLNCAKDYRDGTHWKISDGKVSEWWTDESKCLVESARKKLDSNRHADNIGIASFTPGERRRFAELVEKGKLVDVWRELHPNGSSDNKEVPSWDSPDFTWRGHLSAGNFQSKYEGKGQRIDYFMLSPPSVLTQVQSCDILGYGADRRGHFCGSDHCASIMVLKDGPK